MSQIEKVSQIPFSGFEALKEASIKEGFHFVERLEHEWIKGINQFSQEGEALYKIREKGQLAGIGGITTCPYHSHEKTGRLRRFYIFSSWRRQGKGKQLVQHILDQARFHFHEIVLFTDSQEAAAFYESLGFVSVINQAKISHRWVVGKMNP